MVKCSMIEEIGIVKSVHGAFATVSLPRKSACDGCTAGTCKPEEQSMEIEAVNKAGADVGQKVRVSVYTFTYLKGAMLIYGIPALALVIGAVIGKEVMPALFSGTDPDLLAAAFGFGALILSLAALRVFTSRKGKKPDSKPVIEEILLP